MQRYLLKFSYSGVRLRGLQRQPGELFNEEVPYRASLQTILENSLRKLQPVNQPQVVFSSRTDKGVHSFCNLAHVDLERPKAGEAYSAHSVLRTVNKYFDKSNIGVIVNEVQTVPDTFHARFSSFGRHYMYRIGVSDSETHPMIEWRRCFFIREPFCSQKASEACQLFGGVRDFASFCHGLKDKAPGFPTVRRLDRFEIQPGRPLLDTSYDPLYAGIRFYEFHVQGKSFMYRQVRRMVAAVVAVARNRMTLDELQHLFEHPGEWNSKASTAPPYGLYLLNVDYQLPKECQASATSSSQNP